MSGGIGEMSDEDLHESALVLSRLISHAEAERALLLAELDRRGACEAEVGLTAASWLAREAGLPRAAARRELETGRVLRDLPVITEAVAAGDLSTAHARVLAGAMNPRVADAVAALQPELIVLAQRATFERWRSEVNGIVALLDQDGGHDPTADEARNQVHLSPSPDGMLHLTGQLLGETALGVHEAIEAKADELFHRYRSDHRTGPDVEIPGRATLLAFALADLLRAGGAVELASTRPPRPEVTLVIEADEPSTATAGRTGTRVARGTIPTLRCDPDLYALIRDSLGQVLDLGRAVRHATAAQRRALAARDGGCVFPGCTTPPSWTDHHHVKPFGEQGRTDLANLAALCRRHHGITHRKGWTMHATNDGWFWWTTPSGHTFWSQRHGRQRTGPTPPATADIAA
jgi:hypothetical protein